MQKKAKVHLVISGRVQGVFFRMETKRAADRFGVFGWVRNRTDGTVEAVFEGDKEKVDALIEWCHHGPPHADVKSIQVDEKDYSGEFSEFSVVY